MGKNKGFFKKYRRTMVLIGRIFSILLSLVLVLFCNMFKSIHDVDFDFKIEFVKNFKDPLTWILALSVSIAWGIVYLVVYSTLKEKKILENKAIFVKYDTLNRSKPNNFRDYLSKVENVNRKKNAYLEKMERELEKVQAEIEEYSLNSPKNKKLPILKEKEKEIIYKSTPEYIEKNFISLNAKYNKVRLEHFTLSITGARISDKTVSRERKKFTTKLVTKVISGVIISMSGVSIFSTLTGIFEWQDSGLWITLLMILVSIFLQVYFATSDADNLVDSEIIAPTLVKIDIIENSLLWKEADMKNKPFQKMVDDYIEQQNIELQEKKPEKISMAQLNYLKEHQDEINEQILKEQNNKEELQNG